MERKVPSCRSGNGIGTASYEDGGNDSVTDFTK